MPLHSTVLFVMASVFGIYDLVVCGQLMNPFWSACERHRDGVKSWNINSEHSHLFIGQQKDVGWP